MKKKLLLVDDDENIRFVATLCREDSWLVREASSGKEALEFAVEDPPSVILMDMMMPEMNGETTMQHLRNIKSLQDVPIIFMTAKAQKHEIDHYFDLGALGVVLKPFDPINLPAQIKELMGGSLIASDATA